MIRAIAAFTVATILGSPVAACAAMIARHNVAAEHACCKRKPQPEPKCCLLNAPASSEAKASEAAKVVPLAPVAGVEAGPGLEEFREQVAARAAGAFRFDLFLQNRCLRL